MFSLVICSRTQKISKELEKNIAETIGCEYELVVIDNSQNKYNIFSAYNEGVRRSKGNIICFMHDDIWYKTKKWGLQVEKVLADETIGIVGIIGSYVLTKDFGYWDKMYPFVTGCVQNGENKEFVNDCNCFYDAQNANEVVAVDGMWFCMPINAFQKLSFDEKIFAGFHFYDMDICMQSLVAGYRNIILRNINIMHNCCPQYDHKFVEAMKLFYTKWNSYLPIFRGESVGMSEKEYYRLYLSTKHFYSLLEKTTSYKNSIENSLSYKLGNIIVGPFRWLKKIFKNNK